MKNEMSCEVKLEKPNRFPLLHPYPSVVDRMSSHGHLQTRHTLQLGIYPTILLE